MNALNIAWIFCVLSFLQSDPAHFYGFAYFRQVKDPSIQRGYFQKVINYPASYKICGIF